jgi:hypothetical protein
VPSWDFWRHRAYALLAFVLKVAIVIGLSAGVVSIVSYVRHSASIATYRSAGSCPSPTDALSGEGCRYHGAAKVLSTSSHDPYHASVMFDSLPNRTFIAGWPVRGSPDMATLTVGGTVDGELWDGMVTRLAGKATIGDPELLPAAFYLQTTAISVGGSLLILLIWALALYALAQRRREYSSSRPSP